MQTELVMEFLRKERPTQYKEVLALRLQEPELAEQQITIVNNEINNSDTTIDPNFYDLANDKTYQQKITEQFASTEGIIYLNNYFSTNSLKTIGRTLWENNKKLYFPISKESSINGKITNKIFNYKKSTPVAQIIEHKESGTEFYTTLNQKINYKTHKSIQILNAEFWIYHFHTKNKEYILLSEQELDSQDYIIEGTIYEVEDNPLFGATARLKTHLPLFFVNKATKRIPSFKNHKELFEVLKKEKITKERWMTSLLTHPELKKCYRHPELFESLINAFLLAAKQDYYLHLLIIAEPGSGKSTLEECLWHKFRENQDIIGCGQSTLKSLVPSFKTTPPSPGALINASRISIVDEFLRILNNVDKEDREFQLGRLNDLLENRARAFESGQGKVLGKMTAKFLGVTNPVWNTSSMPKLVKQIDPSFVSRVLVWYQDKEHLKWIYDEKGLQQTSIQPIDYFTFIGVYDYCQSFISTYDDYKVKAVFKDARRLLEDQPDFYRALSVYDARYVHHARCLMDGIVKTRCLFSGDDSFVAREEDYELLKELLEVMIIGWGIYYLPKRDGVKDNVI